MSSIKILLFSNCHGTAYKRLIDSQLMGDFHVNHIITYENLRRPDVKNVYKVMNDSDIIAMTPFQDSKSPYYFSTIRKKFPDKPVIHIPYVRFKGFWPEFEVDNIKKPKIKSSCVEWIPDISIEHVDSYLAGEHLKPHQIKQHYDKHIDKLKHIEGQTDLKFIDHFLQYQTNFMTFKDVQHPVKHMFKFIGDQLCEAIYSIKADNLKIHRHENIILPTIYEHGHYRPVKDKVKDVLGLNYNLDQSYMITRKKFIKDIINYERNTDKIDQITTLDQLYERVFQVHRTEVRTKAKKLDECNIPLPFSR